MKVIAFEEHYKMPAIAQANKAHPIEQIYDTWKQLGRFPGDPSLGVPPGIYALDDKRIAAMDAAGIGFRSFPTQYRVPRNWSRHWDLSWLDNQMMPHMRQSPVIRTDFGALQHYQCAIPKRRSRNSSALSVNWALSAH
jgi:hypothetical protein